MGIMAPAVMSRASLGHAGSALVASGAVQGISLLPAAAVLARMRRRRCLNGRCIVPRGRRRIGGSVSWGLHHLMADPHPSPGNSLEDMSTLIRRRFDPGAFGRGSSRAVKHGLTFGK
ncbi:hypothetical protein GR328_21665 [Microvirga makkahensis]|uniref:Uncharacterized protein n=1 Tax=Microvirga makkahensis TaxID=1128670 RepID=A0A7X3MVP1_9HYPH|nr:hypothetical protein [Microvirga makkahensis]